MANATGKKARKAHGTRTAAKRSKSKTGKASKFAAKQAKKFPKRAGGKK